VYKYQDEYRDATACTSTPPDSMYIVRPKYE